MFRSHTSLLASVLTLAALAAPLSAAVSTQSSPIAVSSDGKTLVNVNPSAWTVSIFDVAGNEPRKVAEVPVGREPGSVALDPTGETAYVANAADGTVCIVTLKKRAVTASLNVGAEPMALCLSPNGSRLYVANSASDSLSVFDTGTTPPSTLATIDLSGQGSAPRAIVVTNNGDPNDSDETVFVAMFYGQVRSGKSFLDEGQDDEREGHLVAISAATNTLIGASNPVILAPMADAGFNSNGQLAPAPGQVAAVPPANPPAFTTPAGAYPNQLAAIALHPVSGLGYVVSTAASPNGPLRFDSMAQGLVSVFNVAARTEVTAGQSDPNVRRTAPLNMNQGIDLATAPVPRLFMTNPVAMAWRPDGTDAWVVVQNSDTVTRLTVDGSGTPSVGAPLVAGPGGVVRVDLENPPHHLLPGQAPRGIAINPAGTRAYVSNFISRSVTAIDISNPTAPRIVGAARSTTPPAPGSVDEFVHLGAELFYTGRGPNGAMSSESWGGCIVCHAAGRSDNVTWMFDSGPRQTISLDAVFDPKQKPADLKKLRFTRDADSPGGKSLILSQHPPRVLEWSAIRDETQDSELNTRNVFGGAGLIEDDRFLFAIGGARGALPASVPGIEEFNQVTGSADRTNGLAGGRHLPDLGGRRDFALATLDDGRIFIIGGRSGPGQGSLIPAAAAVLELDPRTNLVTARGGHGLTPRHSLGAAALRTSDGFRIYAIGGYASTNAASEPIASVEEYDPSTNRWRAAAALPTPVAQFGITLAGGINTAEPIPLIHVVSGNTGSEAAPSLANPNPVQRFQPDPEGPGTWMAFNPTGLTLRRNLGAATIIRGAQSRVFVIGGEDDSGLALPIVEEYQAQAVSFVASTHTPITDGGTTAGRARFGIGSTLSTSQIYVIGGVDASGADQTTVLEYTADLNGPVAGPAGAPSGAWVTRANLHQSRSSLQVSTPPGVSNFLPFANANRNARLDAIAAFVAYGIRTSAAPVPATDTAAMAGRALFGTVGLSVPGFSCAICHGGPKWTRSAVDYGPPPSPETALGFGNERIIGVELRQTATQGPNTGQQPGVLVNSGTFTLGGGRVNEVRTDPADASNVIAPLGANGFNIPSLLSIHETAPYFHSGLAQTLENVLDGSQDGSGGAQFHFVQDPTDRANLVQYLLSIDASTPTFP